MKPSTSEKSTVKMLLLTIFSTVASASFESQFFRMNSTNSAVSSGWKPVLPL